MRNGSPRTSHRRIRDRGGWLGGLTHHRGQADGRRGFRALYDPDNPPSGAVLTTEGYLDAHGPPAAFASAPSASSAAATKARPSQTTINTKSSRLVRLRNELSDSIEPPC